MKIDLDEAKIYGDKVESIDIKFLVITDTGTSELDPVTVRF
jgi:hypothetical protein